MLVPVIGGMGVVFLVTKFAPEARGHGVPEVMDAIFYKDGKIRPMVAVVKSLASALVDRHGCGGRPRRPHHPDRRVARLDHRPDHPHGGLAAHHAGGGGRGRRHRRDLQHAHRRGDVRHRTDDARSQRAHISAGGAGDRHGDLHRALVSGLAPRLRCAAAIVFVEPSFVAHLASALCAARRACRRGGDGLHPRAAHGGGIFRAREEPVSAPRRRHDPGRPDDVCVPALLRPLSYRRRGLFDNPGHSARRHGGGALHGAAVCQQARGDLAQPGLGFVGRHVFAVAVHGRHTGRRVRRGGADDLSDCPT